MWREVFAIDEWAAIWGLILSWKLIWRNIQQKVFFWGGVSDQAVNGWSQKVNHCNNVDIMSNVQCNSCRYCHSFKPIMIVIMHTNTFFYSWCILTFTIFDCTPEISCCTHCAAATWSHNMFAQDFILRVSGAALHDAISEIGITMEDKIQ